MAEKFRDPPPDQIWMETEQTGVGDGWMWGAAVVFVLAIALVITLGVVL